MFWIWYDSAILDVTSMGVRRVGDGKLATAIGMQGVACNRERVRRFHVEDVIGVAGSPGMLRPTGPLENRVLRQALRLPTLVTKSAP